MSGNRRKQQQQDTSDASSPAHPPAAATSASSSASTPEWLANARELLSLYRACTSPATSPLTPVPHNRSKTPFVLRSVRPYHAWFACELQASRAGLSPTPTWQVAVDFLRRAALDQVVLTAPSYGAVLHALDEGGQSELAAQVFNDAIHKRVIAVWVPGAQWLMMDLHGLNAASAKSALRHALLGLRERYLSQQESVVVSDLTVVVGVGKHSEVPFVPVLRPALEKLCLTELSPPIQTMFDSTKNAVVLPAEQIQQWLVQGAQISLKNTASTSATA